MFQGEIYLLLRHAYNRRSVRKHARSQSCLYIQRHTIRQYIHSMSGQVGLFASYLMLSSIVESFVVELTVYFIIIIIVHHHHPQHLLKSVRYIERYTPNNDTNDNNNTNERPTDQLYIHINVSFSHWNKQIQKRKKNQQQRYSLYFIYQHNNAVWSHHHIYTLVVGWMMVRKQKSLYATT